MALSGIELIAGSDLTLDRETMNIVRKFRVLGTLPATGGDAFDVVASYVMAAIQTGGKDKNDKAYGPTYMTPQGILYWNSIQVHESFYGQAYEISVTYGPHQKQNTGTYMVRVEQPPGTAQATAGERISGHPTGCGDNKGVIWNGQEVVGVDVPFSQTRVVVSYRHTQSFLNHTYLRAIGELVGHPNSDTFLGYDPGEISYAGGNATETECEATAEYSFVVSRNESNLVVGGITIGEKKGFDIISPVYKWDTDTDQFGNTIRVRTLHYIEIIRPRGREWKNYADKFGWGGA